MAASSANAGENLEVKEDDVTCPLCFEYYEEDGIHQPKLLSCVHTICLQCVKKLDQAKCPYCAVWLKPPQGSPDQLDTNASVLELLKRYREQQRRMKAITFVMKNGEQATYESATLDSRMPVCTKCHRMICLFQLDDCASSSSHGSVVAQCRQCMKIFCQMCYDVHHQQTACFGSVFLPVDEDISVGSPVQFTNYGTSLYQDFVGKLPILDDEFMEIVVTERLNALKDEIDNLNAMSVRISGGDGDAALQVAQKREKMLNIMADFRELFSTVEPLVLTQYKIEAICCPNGEREKFLRAMLSPLQDVNQNRLAVQASSTRQEQEPAGESAKKLYFQRLGEFIKVNLETQFKGRSWFVIVGNLSMVSICVPDDMQLARFYAWICVNDSLGIIAFDAPLSIPFENLPPVLQKNQQNYEYLDRVLETFAKRNEGNDDAAEAIRRAMESEFEGTLWVAVVAPNDVFALVPQPRGVWAIYPSGPIGIVHRNTRYLWQTFLVDSVVASVTMNISAVVQVKKEALKCDFDLIRFD